MIRRLLFAVAICASEPAAACQLPMDHPSFLFGRIVASWHETAKHPLVGRVYDPAKTEPDLQKSQFKSYCLFADDFWIMASKPEVLLLGEVHDNPEHHRIRESLFQLGAIVTAHLTTDRAADFARFQDMAKATERTLTLDDFKAWTSWGSTAGTIGWNDDIARMLFDVSVQGKIPVYAGDVPRDAIRRVSMEGEAALKQEEVDRLHIKEPLGAELDAAALTELEDDYCRTLPREALGGMAYAQRYRDASLADALIKAAEKHGSAVLVADNSRVRTDRGVPWYLRQRMTGKTIVSVSLIEVEDGKNDPESYVPRDPDGKPATDYILFTPKAKRDDPCAAATAATAAAPQGAGK